MPKHNPKDTWGSRDPELKPCPFCGGEGVMRCSNPYTHQDGDYSRDEYFVHCISCAAEGPWFKTETAAKRVWNMRI